VMNITLERSAEVGPEFVHLVEHEDGIARATAPEALDDAAWECADVGPAVPSNLRLVADAPERDSQELPPHGAGNRATQRRLPHPGRPDETQDRPLGVALEFANRQVLEDSLLDLRQVVVVLVEDASSPVDVEVVLRRHAPGQLDEPVEIRPGDGVLCGGGRDSLEAVEFAFGLAHGLLGQLGLAQLLAEFLDLGRSLVAHPEFALDRLELLPQVVFPLRASHLVVDLALDLRGHLQGLDLAVQQRDHPLQALGHVGYLEDRLPLLQRQADVRRHEVRQAARVAYVQNDPIDLLRRVRQERDHPLEEIHHSARESLELDRVLDRLLDRLHPSRDHRLLADYLDDADALDPADDHPRTPVGHLQHLEQDARSPHPVMHRSDFWRITSSGATMWG